jgi:hypothetical protein
MSLNGFRWPEGRDFAFTVFDDPDAQTLPASRDVYTLLEDLGLRTTKAVWVMEPQARNSGGETCASADYLAFCRELQAKGFEIAYHNGAPGTLERHDTIRSLDLFRSYFGHDPVTMANHYNEEAIYWGDARLSGSARAVYRTVTRAPSRFHGHVEGHPCFWGDVCRERIRYCRNFVYRTLNTLRACPVMPYADPERPYVQAWYASAEGANRASFVARLAEREQDRLEAEHGAGILYTHFGHGFVDGGRIDPEFRRLMTRLSARNGWFVPVATLLDYLASCRGVHVLTPAERRRLEWSWLSAKLVHGTS